MTLVVLGDLMVDVVTRVSGPLAAGSDTAAQISMQGGGSAANVAAWAADLGTPVSLVCRVGRDARGRAAVDELKDVDVNVAVDYERPTGTCVVLVGPDGERTMLPDPGANDAPLPEIPLGKHLHVVGYALLRDGPRASALAAIERARAGARSRCPPSRSTSWTPRVRATRSRPASSARGSTARSGARRSRPAAGWRPAR
jgi:ribokinase